MTTSFNNVLAELKQDIKDICVYDSDCEPEYDSFHTHFFRMNEKSVVDDSCSNFTNDCNHEWIYDDVLEELNQCITDICVYDDNCEPDYDKFQRHYFRLLTKCDYEPCVCVCDEERLDDCDFDTFFEM
jgi:hypothetical protein